MAKSSNPAIEFAATHVSAAEHPILRLQRTAGNQAVLRWLRPRAVVAPVVDTTETEEKPDVEPAAKITWPNVIPVIMMATIVAYFCYRIAAR